MWLLKFYSKITKKRNNFKKLFLSNNLGRTLYHYFLILGSKRNLFENYFSPKTIIGETYIIHKFLLSSLDNNYKKI